MAHARNATTGWRPRILSHDHGLVVVLIALGLAAWPNDTRAQHAQLDQSSLVMERPAMATLLEKTIFKVDVAWLELWFAPDVDQKIREFAAGQPVHRDSIAAVATQATDALARLRFERDVTLGQFLDGLQGSARRARDADIISPSTYEDIVASSPRWYAFLDERGIRDGDTMLYRIHGDTLRTVFQSADGSILLDQRDIGAERRLSVLGGYLAPGSDFRRGLIESAVLGTTRDSARTRAGHD